MGKQKYKIVSQLLDETMQEISQSEENWCKFLTTSSRLYKYPFEEQVLIFAQRPDATACASVDIWNHRMNCWINRGAKGIALIDESRYGKLKYVFDVSDVHKGRWRGRLPYLWDMKDVHQEPVMERLEELYGKTDETAAFVDRVREIADRITDETARQLFEDMAELKQGSRLALLDEANLKLRLQITLSDSVAYSILKRCGVPDSVLEDTIGFMYIPEFDTPDTLLALGNNTSELAKPVLMEIGKCIWAFDREQEKLKAQEKAQNQTRETIAENGRVNTTVSNAGSTDPGFGKSVEMLLAEAEEIKARKKAETESRKESRGELSDGMEKNSNLVLANTPDADYNALKRESNKQEETIQTVFLQNEEGRQDDEIRIRTERGLHDTDAPDGRAAEGNSDEIRTDETAVPQRAQEYDLQDLSSEGNAERAPSFDSGTGRGEGRSADSTDGQSRGRERAAQGREPDALGAENEQHPAGGRGDSAGGNYLLLENNPVEKYEQLSLFPSFGEQVGTVMAAEADTVHVMPAVFSLSQEQIHDILRSGGGRRDSRKRIYAKYQQGKSPEEITEFLKNEYGTTGKGFILDNNPIAVWFDGSGMRAGYGVSAIDSAFLWMDWQEIENHVRNMVMNGSYMSEAEVFLVDESERLRVANDIYYFFRDGVPDLWAVSESHKNTAPESIQELCSLLSDNTGRQELLAEIEEAWELLEVGVITQKWKYVKSPHYLMEQIEDLGREKMVYPCTEHVEVRNEDFITRDEINYRLTQGSSFVQGKFRIYKYFTEEYSKKDTIDFLKHEYGTGGGSHALPGNDFAHENHDAKGIKLEKGSYMEPYAEVLLNWNIVEKRIRELIKAGKYLTEAELEDYRDYVQKQSEKELDKAHKNLEMEQEHNIAADNTEIELDRYETVLTSDAFEEPFAVWDNKEDDYYVLDGMVQTFETEEEADALCATLNEEINAGEQSATVIKANEIPLANFHIKQDMEETGRGFAPKEKFHQNVEAIRLLQKIEAENRTATPEEQQTLSRYAGWGGLSDAFDLGKTNWHTEYQELKNLLSPEEYASARESTLNAHYTSPAIIQGIYDVIDRMGFSDGTILEPAMGTGHFFGMLPETMQNSRLYGVELDSISGRIAKQLYPNADIRISGFEKTNFPNEYFDVAVGNVPFGQYKVLDREYDRHNLSVHDYFIVKSLDKLKAGGIAALITSKSTMDKKNPHARTLMAQRAEFLGAIRLPNTAFKENAGTEVTSDILFFQKRERMEDVKPDWVYLSENENGIAMNSYFCEHPEMILGTMELVSGPYGKEAVCLPDLSSPLSEQLRTAGEHISGQITTVSVEPDIQINTDGVRADRMLQKAEFQELEEIAGMDALSGNNGESAAVNNYPEEIPEVLSADPNVKNYSYTIVDGHVYYRENSNMLLSDASETAQARIKAMVALRDCTQKLIELQMNEYPQERISSQQEELNSLYDAFSNEYGLIHSQANRKAFRQDSSYFLLCSLENLDEEGNFKGKADIFYKRTIRRAEAVTSVDTAAEALAVSLSEKAGVDLSYMEQLCSKTQEEIVQELSGVIFQNPVTEKWETADEYLSGNVREKLHTARIFAENNPEYSINVSALEQVQPKELEASEIEVRIGATWIGTRYIEDFMCEVFETPEHLLDKGTMAVQYSEISGQWNIKGKTADYGNTLANMTYGTSRANAYRLLEDSLNLRDIRIFDTVMEDGKEKRVLNKKETLLASQKQESIREAFKDWIFSEPKRRNALCKKYNEQFNSIRPREYDGSHLKFPGMTADITLRPHQLNAVAHQLYGNNTLLAHCVGAGKTFEMIAAAMESKRLGLCQKSMFVVPNHLTEQWASDFMRLYPSANILAATKKDFEPANRKKFCSRIATGDFDAVIIGHTQFERIPLSVERQAAVIEKQIEEIQRAIAEAKAEKGENYTIKQMEKTRKNLLVRLEKLNAEEKKDNVVTFEQLGVDRLFVDESQSFKNLFLYTKMRNVAGIAQAEAQKSSDMYAKCRYMDEITGGKGITFATGTPISNSMTELYTNMRYLQFDTLQKLGLGNFDAWASTFGETQTAIELAPEGTGYRAKTRFAKFYNLPELIALFKECADIQTPDMLKLPVPEAEYENVVLKPSEFQKEMVRSLADRAEAVRNSLVEPYEDNMLKITNDGRKLALDQRLINEMLPDNENSKAAACVERAFQIWKETGEQKSTQLIFSDLATPKGDGSFNIYDDIRNKLVEKGVPREEIKFIHEANTEAKKAELFAKVRSGQVRFLLGSTAKMGAGTNVQDRLIALHHLDVPWRPSDIEQQEGRILRQGNQNEKVYIFCYVTEQTFDSYSWQVIENKQKFIGQIMTSKLPVRSCEDIDEAALSYAEVKALATGNPYIKEKMALDIEVSKLKLLKANHTSQKYRMEDNITQHYPKQIAQLKELETGFESDIQMYAQNKFPDKESFSMQIGNRTYIDKKEAGAALLEMCRNLKSHTEPVLIGAYQGFQVSIHYRFLISRFVATLKGKLGHEVELGADAIGNLQRLNNALDAMPAQFEEIKQKHVNVEHQLETAKTEVAKPFQKEAELKEKQERLNELNAFLNMDEKDESILAGDEADSGAVMVAEVKHEYKADRPLELQTAEKICRMLGRENCPQWDENSASIVMKENGETLKGKAVYDVIFSEAGTYIREQILSGNNAKGMEMTDLLKEAGEYAKKHYPKQQNRISIREKLKSKQIEVNKYSADLSHNASLKKTNMEL